MNRFEFARAASVAEALDLVAEKPGRVYGRKACPLRPLRQNR
jgi:hypothetical protein